jgi:hypothetical protein
MYAAAPTFLHEPSSFLLLPIADQSTGYQAACQFLKRNNLLSIIRANEAFYILLSLLSHARREQSEKVPELKSVSSSSRLPYGTPALAYVYLYFYFWHQLTICSGKSDIENERLPPDLFYADSEAIISQPTIPAEMAEAAPELITSNGVAAGLERKATPGRINTSPATTPPLSAFSLHSPTSTSPGGLKRGQSRQASGTTMTSPSTPRSSLENTMSLIQGALKGSTRKQVDGLANRMAGSSLNAGRSVYQMNCIDSPIPGVYPPFSLVYLSFCAAMSKKSFLFGLCMCRVFSCFLFSSPWD